MRVRHHRGFGHGLRPGSNQDINCIACQREKDAGTTPSITGTDDTPYTPRFPGARPIPAHRLFVVTEIPVGA